MLDTSTTGASCFTAFDEKELTENLSFAYLSQQSFGPNAGYPQRQRCKDRGDEKQKAFNNKKDFCSQQSSTRNFPSKNEEKNKPETKQDFVKREKLIEKNRGRKLEEKYGQGCDEKKVEAVISNLEIEHSKKDKDIVRN